jgi:hypothetical protein
MYFGVFFDVHENEHWINAIGKYRKKGERWKEGLESDVQDNKAYKVGMLVEGTAKNVVDKLPPNPVSNAIKKGLDAKDKVAGIKDKVEGAVGSVTGAVDNISDKVLNNDYVQMDGFDPLGANSSIISKMEPAYCGGLFENEGENYWSDYNYRIYAQGGVLADDLKPPKEKKDEDTSEADDAENEAAMQQGRTNFAQEAVKEALKAIESKIGKAAGQKLSLHFDIFGYAKDAAIDDLEPELKNLKGKYPDINEISIDHTGRYNNLNDPDEVRNDLGGIEKRFRNQKFLETNG